MAHLELHENSYATKPTANALYYKDSCFVYTEVRNTYSDMYIDHREGINPLSIGYRYLHTCFDVFASSSVQGKRYPIDSKVQTNSP